MADVKQWITIKGRHIPIFEGESKADAIKRLKEGARKGKEKQQEMHSKDKQAKKEAFDKAREKQKKKHQAMEKEPTERRKEAYKKAAEDTIKKKQAFEDAMSGKVKSKFRKKHMNESEFKDIMSNEDSATRRQKLGSFMSHATPGAVVDTGTGYKVTMEEDGLWKDSNGEHHLTDDLVKHLSNYHKMTAADRKEWNNQKAKKKSFEEATARIRAKESPYQRLKTLQDHDYEELTSAEKKELKSLQEKAYKGELNKKAAPSSGSDAISKTASRLQKKGFNDPESIEKHLRELSSVRRNRLAKELGVEGRGDEKIKAMTKKIHEAQGGKKAEPAKSWQDKDAETKAKQIANAEKQKNERNPGGAPYKEDRNDKNVRALRSMAEKADTRKIITGEKAFEGKQASWAPKIGDKISDVGHNEAQNKLYDAPIGTTFEMTSRDGDYVGEYTKQSDGSWKGSQKYKSGYKMPPTVYTPKGFAMNVVGNDIKVTNNGSEKKADWKDVDTKPQKSKKVNLSTTYTNAMNSVDADKVERAITKLTKNGGSSAHIKDLEEKLYRLRHSEYKEDPSHYNGKGMY